MNTGPRQPAEGRPAREQGWGIQSAQLTPPIQGLQSCRCPSGFAPHSQRVRRLRFLPCTESWVDMANLWGLQQPQLQPAILEHVLQNPLCSPHRRTWESQGREEWRSPEGQRESGSWRSLLRTRKLSACPETSTHVRLDPWLSASATLLYCYCSEGSTLGFPGGSAGKESARNAGDLGSLPALGRSPGEGKGYPLQYSGLENYSPWGRKESDTTKQLARLRYYSNTQGLVFYTQPLINLRALSLYIILFNLGQRSPTWPSYRF